MTGKNMATVVFLSGGALSLAGSHTARTSQDMMPRIFIPVGIFLMLWGIRAAHLE